MNRNVRNAKLRKYIQILEEYRDHSYEPLSPLTGQIWDDAGEEKEAIDDLKTGRAFGGARKNFRLEGAFRAGERTDCETILVIDLGKSRSLEALSFLYGPEAVVSVDGEEMAGLDPNHAHIVLEKKYLDHRLHRITLDGWTGIKEEVYEVGRIGICYRHKETDRLLRLCRVCYETAEKTGQESLYGALEDSLNLLDLYEPLGKEFEKSVCKAYQYLEGCLQKWSVQPELKSAACGHGHLDLAWLWRTSQAKKKGTRTFLNVLRLMEAHPQFRYSQTQAQLYEWIEKERPEIFERIRRAVREGRWEILGGMWVEPDCNLTGAESLVRQFLLFYQYMKEKFSTTGSPVVWLPDTFGFCGQLPQIMKDAGYLYFATAKLTWNQYNKMPSEYFWWEGIDGSRVLSHLVSTSKPGWWGATYSADLTPEELLSTKKECRSKGLHDELLIAYGMGDGGGGPTEEMVRRGELMEKYKIPELPEVSFKTFRNFFDRMEKDSARFPVWNGELYLELHRGTYTSQAETKRKNRLCEAALHRTEFLSAFASEETGCTYPAEELREMWKKICLNQFHDILPGSSIAEVYEDAGRDYEEVMKRCGALAASALRELEGGMAAGTKAVVVNDTSFPQSGIVRLPFILKEGQCAASGGRTWESVNTGEGTWVKVENVPPYGYLTLSVEDEKRKIQKKTDLFAGTKTRLSEGYQVQKDTQYILFNEKIWAEFNGAGDITVLRDREEERDILPPDQKFFQWRLYEDRPADWDAWDLDEDYTVKGFKEAVLESAEVFETAGMQAGFCMRKRIGGSTIVQKISLDADSKDIRMQVKLDFQETHEHLRLVCPVQIHNTYATFGTQFGSVLRNTHYNTSWDKARFETCMHGWADYSEGDYGVAFLCDNKYGISIHENVVSIAVSKSAGFPDPLADKGTQEFTAVVSLHHEKEKKEIIKKAYLLTHPLQIYEVQKAGGMQTEKSMVHSGAGHIVIETVKRSEDGNGTIVRAYEYANTRGKAEIYYGKNIQRAARCTVLEEEKYGLFTDKNKVEEEYHPYEIMTLRIQGGDNEGIGDA